MKLRKVTACDADNGVIISSSISRKIILAEEHGAENSLVGLSSRALTIQNVPQTSSTVGCSTSGCVRHQFLYLVES